MLETNQQRARAFSCHIYTKQCRLSILAPLFTRADLNWADQLSRLQSLASPRRVSVTSLRPPPHPVRPPPSLSHISSPPRDQRNPTYITMICADNGDDDWLRRHSASDVDGKDRCLVLLRLRHLFLRSSSCKRFFLFLFVLIAALLDVICLVNKRAYLNAYIIFM